ncbi:hypothetical protein Gohar_003867 [Gossypium harknessii]|uniref:BTB domain-containing protein n=1 Tax=Gossypium harknessii TaxID=34285 RepID=A0A7J9H380_9ROSI|nr:hypothetical protein [Gossypium harknessii]
MIFFLQDAHNQVGIVQSGGIVPLLSLLDSKGGPLQHNSAFALYGLAENEDNVVDLIKTGGVQKLLEGDFIAQALSHLLYLMRTAAKAVQKRVALALAHLCAPNDRKTIFVDNNGIAVFYFNCHHSFLFLHIDYRLELLLGLLESKSFKQQKDGSEALYKLATKGTSLSSVDAAPVSPTAQVYLGEQYVNNPTLSDVTFLVEGKRFYAHRICLLASSDAFRAMFDGGYRERDAKDVEIPNIRWDVFVLMMRYIYTGSVTVEIDHAQELLRAADQYLLEGLKRLCEYAIAQDISVEDVMLMYELAEAFNATTLRETCLLFILEQFERISTKPWCGRLIQRVIPDLRNFFVSALVKCCDSNVSSPLWPLD